MAPGRRIRYILAMAPPPAAAALALTPADAAAERMAALLALPLSDEPLTDEEREAFDEGERFLASGQRGVNPSEIRETIERMRHEQGE